MTPLCSVETERQTPRQRLAIAARLSAYTFAETGYYIVLFRRYMAIHGRKTIWYGEGNSPQFVNINSAKASKAYRNILGMLNGGTATHFDRYCDASPKVPWVCGRRRIIEWDDYKKRNALQRLGNKINAIERAERRLIKVRKSPTQRDGERPTEGE